MKLLELLFPLLPTSELVLVSLLDSMLCTFDVCVSWRCRCCLVWYLRGGQWVLLVVVDFAAFEALLKLFLITCCLSFTLYSIIITVIYWFFKNVSFKFKNSTEHEEKSGCRQGKIESGHIAMKHDPRYDMQRRKLAHAISTLVPRWF